MPNQKEVHREILETCWTPLREFAIELNEWEGIYDIGGTTENPAVRFNTAAARRNALWPYLRTMFRERSYSELAEEMRCTPKAIERRVGKVRDAFVAWLTGDRKVAHKGLAYQYLTTVLPPWSVDDIEAALRIRAKRARRYLKRAKVQGTQLVRTAPTSGSVS